MVHSPGYSVRTDKAMGPATRLKLNNILTILLGIALNMMPGIGIPFQGMPHAAAAVQYETYAQRQRDLVALSGVFGQLHHIRRTCDPQREANIWRQRMQTMIELEEPGRQTHLDMVNAFNGGYQEIRSRFPECTREAQEKGKDLAYAGSMLVQRLTADLDVDLTASGDPL